MVPDGAEEGPGGAEGTAGAGAEGGGGAGGSGGLVLEPLVCGDSDGGGGGGGGGPCVSGPDEDVDGDGFTPAGGDCAPCDPRVNPGAIEVTKTNGSEPVDDDCDGQIDEALATCDGGLEIGSFDPLDAARAIELCELASPVSNSWGVLDADYVRASGEPLNPTMGVGLLDDFGVNPVQGGFRMLGLSSGRARAADSAGACGAESCSHQFDDLSVNSSPGEPPSGPYCVGAPAPCFPQDVPDCPGGSTVFDDVALRLRLRAPTNADGFRFRFKFFSFEYPEWVCTEFNDQFVALVVPPPPGALLSNVSFDGQLNPVSVNVVFFDPSLADDLEGTGFGAWNDAAATAWLETRAPVTGGEEFDLLLAIWDTGDDLFDSTVLVDRFEWLVDCANVVVETGLPD